MVKFVKLETRACFINPEIGDAIESLNLHVGEIPDIFGVYKSSPGLGTLWADFKELEYANLFIQALTVQLQGIGFEAKNKQH